MQIPQGDTRLLEDPTARRLLASTELARVAYLAKDGTPRVIPMLFHWDGTELVRWDGTELVLPTFAGSHKVASMRRHPAVAVTPSRSTGITATTRAGPTPSRSRSLALR